MKIYFSYKDDGEFDGFYNDEIHKQIPVKSVEITQELQDKLLIGSWFIDIEKLNDIKDILDIGDKDNFFVEHTIEALQYIDPEKQSLLRQVASNKLDLMKKDIANNNLMKQVATNKLDLMKKDIINNNLMKQIATNKLDLMKKDIVNNNLMKQIAINKLEIMKIRK